ncbi:hypothetical protein ACFL1B_02760 [Nanoarchaeota archaeon]
MYAALASFRGTYGISFGVDKKHLKENLDDLKRVLGDGLKVISRYADLDIEQVGEMQVAVNMATDDVLQGKPDPGDSLVTILEEIAPIV